MQSVEIAARSVDEAVRLALEQLGKSRDEVRVEILMDTSAEPDGEALVRVSIPGAQPPRSSPKARRDGFEGQEYAEQVAKEVVNELLTRMGFQCNVVAVNNPSAIPLDDDEPPTVFIDVMGRNLGMLIGRRGEHLAQIQYLVNVLVNHRLPTWTRVVLDVEGYRIRREEAIINLARRVARQVARNRRPISLEPMPPSERRIVHVALRDEPDVTTQSSGEGALRRVTIYPKQPSRSV